MRRMILAVAAAAAVIAIAVLLAQTDRPTGEQGAAPVEVAAAFLEAYAVGDTSVMESYLSDEAMLSAYNQSVDDLGLVTRWAEAAGYRVLVKECVELPGADPGWVRCNYDYHGLRSDETGLGPYTGSWWDFNVAGDKIVSGQDRHSYRSNRFHEQMWEPFANWLHENHRGDLQILYEDTTRNLAQVKADLIPLWEQRTREYAEATTED